MQIIWRDSNNMERGWNDGSNLEEPGKDVEIVRIVLESHQNRLKWWEHSRRTMWGCWSGRNSQEKSCK